MGKGIIRISIINLLGFISGWMTVKLVELIFRSVNRRKANEFFKHAQVLSGAAMAFMHGAQDGRSLWVFYAWNIFSKWTSRCYKFSNSFVDDALMLLNNGIGTSIGGYRIIKSVEICADLKIPGFSADMAAACLFISSMTGIPVSTTHQDHGDYGRGGGKKIILVNWGIVKEMVMTWILTFPDAE